MPTAFSAREPYKILTQLRKSYFFVKIFVTVFEKPQKIKRFYKLCNNFVNNIVNKNRDL